MSIDSLQSPPTRQQGGARARALLSAFTIMTRYPVLLVLGLVTLVVQISYSGINNVTLPKYIPDLGVPAMLEGRITGAVISTFLLAETFLRIPFGWLSDRYGRGKMIVGAMLLTAPSFWLTGMVSSYLWLFPLRAWDGMMAAALWPSLFALIGDRVPERFRANAMGVINMMYMLALFCGWGLAGFIFTRTENPRLFFQLATALIGFGGVGALIFFSRAQRPAREVDDGAVDVADENDRRVPASRHAILLTITFTQNFAITLLAPFMFRYVTEDLGFSLAQLGVLVGAPMVGIAIFALPLSRVGDHLGKLFTVRLAFTAIAAALWFFAFQTTLVGLSLTVTVIGIAFSMGIPAWLAMLCSLSSSKRRGVTLAGYGTVQGGAAVLGPLASGWIWDTLGHGQIFLASAAVITLAALLAWLALPKQETCSPKTLTAV